MGSYEERQSGRRQARALIGMEIESGDAELAKLVAEGEDRARAAAKIAWLFPRRAADKQREATYVATAPLQGRLDRLQMKKDDLLAGIIVDGAMHYAGEGVAVVADGFERAVRHGWEVAKEAMDVSRGGLGRGLGCG